MKMSEMKLDKEAPQANRWIPITEDVPDAYMTVLIYAPDASEPVDLGYLGGDEWRSCQEGVVSVTHWRPLPSPPE